MRAVPPISFLILIAIAGVVAAAMRLPQLADRPMHTDEAVNAVIVDTLRSNAEYSYDPVEHHGPSLPFLTLSSLRLAGVTSFAETTEEQLRRVTAWCGVLLVVLLGCARPLLGGSATAIAAILAAISPAAVYYSRYYIHEMLLVTFTVLALVAIGRAVSTPHRLTRWAWFVAGGVGLGLMHATKETCVISFGGMAVGLIAARFQHTERSRTFTIKRALVIVVPGVVTSLALFSFFATDGRGPIDSLATFGTYLRRAGGDTPHVQTWTYYFELLGFTRHGPYTWSEAAIAVGGVLGVIATLRRRLPATVNIAFARFLVGYTLSVTAVYVAIPYKTPWCVLEFWVPWMLLAGLGVSATWHDVSHRGRYVLGVATLAAIGHLGYQAYLASFPLAGSYRNPYVYAHPLSGVTILSDYTHALVALHPDGHATPVFVVSDHPWPLPWYLRDLTRVGYWDDATAATRALSAANADANAFPIVIVDDTLADEVADALPEGYFRNTYGLRPNVRLVLFVEPSLRRAFVESFREPPLREPPFREPR